MRMATTQAVSLMVLCHDSQSGSLFMRSEISHFEIVDSDKEGS